MATIYKRGDRYYLQWADLKGRHKRTLGKITKLQAETILHAKEVELQTGVNPLEKNTVPLLSQFATRYLDWHKGEASYSSQVRTAGILKSHLLPVFGNKTLDQITPESVDAYKRGRIAAASTINKELNVLKAVLRRAELWGVIASSPIKGGLVTKTRELDSKPPNFYTADELQRIYDTDPEFAPVYKLIANTGMRRAEAFNLEWKNVRTSSVQILSSTAQRTKSAKWRQVPLSPGAEQALKELANASMYVLPRMNPRSLTRRFEKALIRSGLSGTLHDLRHTFCSHLVMQGVPLRAVQVLAGHAHISTTEKYSHLAPDFMQSSVAGLHL